MTSFNMWNESATNARDPTAYPARSREQGRLKKEIDSGIEAQNVASTRHEGRRQRLRLTYDDFDEEESGIDDQQSNQSCFS